jgi:hypothetical protein
MCLTKKLAIGTGSMEDSWTAGMLPSIFRPPLGAVSARARKRRQLTCGQDCHRMGVWMARYVRHMLDVGHMRGANSWHGAKIVSGGIVGSEVVGDIVGDLVVAWSRGGFRSPRLGYIDEQSVFNGLPIRKTLVQSLADSLFGTQHSFCKCCSVGRVSGDKFQSDIWRVDASTKRVGIFGENGISNVIDQVVVLHLDSSSRSTWSFHPYLAVHHCLCLDNMLWDWRYRRHGVVDGGVGGSTACH